MMTVPDMMKYRYIVSVEGNDVATNLKWALASGSVVLMPAPTVETFFAEGALIPYFHYIPVMSDMSDLELKIIFCEHHLAACERIGQNGRAYATQFSDIQALYRYGAQILESHITRWMDILKKRGLNTGTVGH